VCDDGIEWAALERLHMLGGEAFVAEMLDLALGNIAEQLVAGRAAASRNDPKGFVSALHSIAGSAGNLGAVELEGLARQGLARGDPTPGTNLLDDLARLEAAFARARPLLLEAMRDRK